MTTPHHFPSESDSLEGRVFRPATHAELVEAVEQAFDYRGDVSLELASGQTVEGMCQIAIPMELSRFFKYSRKAKRDCGFHMLTFKPSVLPVKTQPQASRGRPG